MTEYRVGVDAGGTRTRVVLMDESGRELVRAEGSAGLVDGQGVDRVADTIAELVRTTIGKAGVALPVDALWAGVAGAGRSSTRARLEAAMRRSGVARRLEVGTDVQAAFADAFGDGAGILLISGTGSIAQGRAEDGRMARVGGWGSRIGDEGSGWAIGCEALRCIARSEDGRSPATLLHPTLVAALDLKEFDRLPELVASMSKAEIAALAPAVAAAARDGDSTAGEIIAQAVRELVLHISTLTGTLGPWSEPPRLALAGGLLARGGPLRAPLTEALVEAPITILDRSPDGALGAAWMAGRLAPT